LEQKNIIDKLANFVARNGPEFEQMTKQKQKDNAKFSFLFGGEYYQYYQFKVNAEQSGFLHAPPHPVPESGPLFHYQGPPGCLINVPPHQDKQQDALKQQQQQQQQQQQAMVQHAINQQVMPPNAPWQTTPPPTSGPPNMTQGPPPPPGSAGNSQTPLSGLQQQLQQQVAQMQEQIKHSEQNLSAQYQSLIQQQQMQIEDAILKCRMKMVEKLAEDCDIDLDELDKTVQPIIESCTKDAILNGKSWIFTHCYTEDHCKLIAQYLLNRITDKESNFDVKLHLIYLINDLLHHCQRKNADELKTRLEDIVVPAFCTASVHFTEDKKQKLTKLLNLWDSNKYFDIETIRKLKDPVESVAKYQAGLITEYSQLVTQITASVQAQYGQLQKQHQEFASHFNVQLQQRQEQLQLLQHVGAGPPPQAGSVGRDNPPGPLPSVVPPILPPPNMPNLPNLPLPTLPPNSTPSPVTSLPNVVLPPPPQQQQQQQQQQPPPNSRPGPGNPGGPPPQQQPGMPPPPQGMGPPPQGMPPPPQGMGPGVPPSVHNAMPGAPRGAASPFPQGPPPNMQQPGGGAGGGNAGGPPPPNFAPPPNFSGPPPPFGPPMPNYHSRPPMPGPPGGAHGPPPPGPAHGPPGTPTHGPPGTPSHGPPGSGPSHGPPPPGPSHGPPPGPNHGPPPGGPNHGPPGPNHGPSPNHGPPGPSHGPPGPNQSPAPGHGPPGPNQPPPPQLIDYGHGLLPPMPSEFRGPPTPHPSAPLPMPDFSKPPPGFPQAPPPMPLPTEMDLTPSVPYYELPAGLISLLVNLEDCEYKSLDPKDIRLPPPFPPSERLLAAVEAFYSAPSHDRPRDSEGWEKLGLYEFLKLKQMAKKVRDSEVVEKDKDNKHHASDRFRGQSDSPRPRSRSRSNSPRTRSRRRYSTKRSHSRSKSKSPLPYLRSSKSRSPSPARNQQRSQSPSPPNFGENFLQPPVYDSQRIGEDNKGHQMLMKMGWSGKGLGVTEQGIVDPISGGDCRNRQDMYKGVGFELNDPFEQFRKSKSQGFIQRMKARDEARIGEKGKPGNRHGTKSPHQRSMRGDDDTAAPSSHGDRGERGERGGGGGDRGDRGGPPSTSSPPPPSSSSAGSQNFPLPHMNH
ncbi:calcium homeostasis endoplasmic reticulum protein-like isoform X2, partial [Argonauta hians]